ncbi:MAG: TRAP transporter large permease [Alphaproteobacteria bacterium]|mgnify:CR=1 FL=1|jgi:C4-dicarboxylate transporter, DctM subunit|nr:TRAP transporter large permease [Alphaproteobacteria bacterium]MBU1551530.1 TRAP transporter large permease [Alphaproteobacteria bacterium]MBU2337265.1 TRAP transporter large permease [Alphaproteobacteria bacterium]MBU2388008.1 TRAP transporter large permease [Alphaproteobacteria bacterium]MDY6960348.1 TRAP transporter large permease [Pseudomonadota bacterium]
MSNIAIGLVGTFCLFGGILLGINVMVVLGLVGAFGLAALVGFNAATALMSTVFFETTHSFHFSVIPLFLLMGFFAMRAGLGEDLFEATTKWMGNLKGGLAISTTLGAAAFGAASGSSVGTATVFTKLALPQMLDRGYDKSLASASIAIAGTLAVMIPPSALVVVYGILTDSSIGALLIAGFIPGIIFALMLCLAIWLTVLRRPELAPVDRTPYTLREKLVSLRLAGPLVLVIFCIVAGLYVGIFTPTEAGGVGAGLTFLLAVVRHRGLGGVRIGETLMETIRTSAMIFAILISALLFSKFLALSGVTNALGGFLTGLDVAPWIIVVLISLIYLALGMMMDAPALLAVTLPITHPVMMNLGYDPIWFGVFVVLLVEIGAVTPPVGINCFVVQAASGGRVKLEDVFRGLIPFVLAGFAMLVLLYLVPDIALFLPSRM